LKVFSYFIILYQVQKRRNERKKWKKRLKYYKIIIKSKVMLVKVLNLNLDLLSKDLEMKLIGIIEEYEAFSFSNFF